MSLVEELRAEVKQKRIEDASELQPILSRKLMELLRGDDDNSLKENPDGITVILFVGVNGVGKTTTIGKLAHRYKQEGKRFFSPQAIPSGLERLSSLRSGANGPVLTSLSSRRALTRLQ